MIGDRWKEKVNVIGQYLHIEFNYLCMSGTGFQIDVYTNDRIGELIGPDASYLN